MKGNMPAKATDNGEFDVDQLRNKSETLISELNEFMQGYRILCVTPAIESESMWERYAENGQGVALRIEAYSSTKISGIVDRINNSIFLPAIQRPYVWETSQIVALFDSLLKGYPISSFLFWELDETRRADWEIYKFIDNFRQGGMHNELAETDGREITLVLDGQQRLTSLLIGLRGTYTTRRKYARKENPDAWTKQRLYLDPLKSPKSDDEDGESDIGISYGLKFFEHMPLNSSDHLWFKVCAAVSTGRRNTLIFFGKME